MGLSVKSCVEMISCVDVLDVLSDFTKKSDRNLGTITE